MRAVRTFEGTGANDLSFEQGDFLIGHQHIDGWWYGEHTSVIDIHGKLLSGEFPNNYVEYVSQDADENEEVYDDELSDIEEGEEDDGEAEGEDGEEDIATEDKKELLNDAAYPPNAVTQHTHSNNKTATQGAATVAAATASGEAEQRREERRKARIRDEREKRAHAVEEARLSEIENVMLRNEIMQKKLVERRRMQKSQALRNKRRRLAKQTRKEKLKRLTPESRKLFKMKMRELASNATKEESKNIGRARERGGAAGQTT